MFDIINVTQSVMCPYVAVKRSFYFSSQYSLFFGGAGFSTQITNKTLSSSSQLELENRLHQLTETLIQKQTMLESLSTEKNSLVYQLERLEQQLKTVQGTSVNGPSINMAGIDNGEGKKWRKDKGQQLKKQLPLFVL